MTANIALPVGSAPNERQAVTVEGSEEEQTLHSIPESSVILQSLRQSREKWLSFTFPRFSAKARGSKVPAVAPPPHTIKSYGRYNLSIGPHQFPNTAIFEVQYLPPATPAALHPARPPPVVAPPRQETLTWPLQQDPVITPVLIEQLSAAASTDPVLSNLIQLATAGKASPDQIQTLSLLIQTLQVNNRNQAQNTTSQSIVAPPPPPPAKEFDIVIEFQERSTERLIFPRGPVVCDVESSYLNGQYSNLCVRILVPPCDSPDSPPKSIATVAPLHWHNVMPPARELFMRWVGGEEKMAANRKILVDVTAKSLPKRTFLRYQLPDGEMLASVQSAVAPQYSTKSIKPTQQDIARQRRRAARKASEPQKATDHQPAKRKRTTKANQPPAPLPIACHACGQPDVPLLMGGRYCRTCVESGKGVAVTPLPTPVSKGSTSHAPPTLQVRMYAPPVTGVATSHNVHEP
ncbi:hypothetical protein BXZ70DRAFT_1078354 [Cristinia sonorae]|uniref:Uncharacterized protein n=1 Tax=Cristinia sonorae TaxID=1940300 RepID=A0A8K0XP93_9AGAR|nr:hypothetical protein BXZ70DRAFT_1078354 [Cristinia sonorae]